MRKLDFFLFEFLLNSSTTDIVLVTLPSTAVETATAQCTSRWAMARGHRLNTSFVLAAVRGLSGLFRAVSAVEPSLFRPLSPLSPSLVSHLASVDVKQNGPSFVCYFFELEHIAPYEATNQSTAVTNFPAGVQSIYQTSIPPQYLCDLQRNNVY